MPARKNQHFVPRCYMRHFSVNGEGKAINLHNMSRTLSVQGAPIKGQCSRSYIYGKGTEDGLEQFLGKLETNYAFVVQKIVAKREAGPHDIRFLREFMMLQNARTMAAVERIRSTIAGLEGEIQSSTDGRLPEMDTDDRTLMLRSLSMLPDFLDATSDLRTCFVKNRSRIEFVTSDDPVQFTSRFHAMRNIGDAFGFLSSGALLFLPLTPKLLMLCYDHNVYSVSRRNKFLETKSDRDVEACNELQYLNARENVYFRDWSQVKKIEARAGELREKRAAQRIRFTRFEKDGASSRGGMQRYRSMAAGERMKGNSMIIGHSHVRLFPDEWLSRIQIRKKPKCIFDGSAAGLRRPTATSGRRGQQDGRWTKKR